jgi:dUTP pyrophosphatase
MDLRACIDGPLTLEPFKPVAVPTGLAMEILPGYMGEIRSRSGLALKHGVQVGNAPGTIDPGYRGEVKVILVWSGQTPNWYVWDEQTYQYGTCIGSVQKEGTEWPKDDPSKRYVLKAYGFRVYPGDRIAQLVIVPYVSCYWDVVDETTDSVRGAGGFGSTGV